MQTNTSTANFIGGRLKKRCILVQFCVVFNKYCWTRARRRFVVVPRKRAQQCCDIPRQSQKRNVGACCAKSLTGFKLYAISANSVVVACKRVQHVGLNNVACCWTSVLRLFSWGLQFHFNPPGSDVFSGSALVNHKFQSLGYCSNDVTMPWKFGNLSANRNLFNRR